MPRAKSRTSEHQMFSVVLVVGSIALFLIGVVITELLFTSGLNYFSDLRDQSRAHPVAAAQLYETLTPNPAVVLSTLVTTNDHIGGYQNNHVMAVGSDGLPVMTYYQETHTAGFNVLKLSVVSTVVQWFHKIVGLNSVHAGPSIDFPEPGGTRSSLMFMKCTDVNCTHVKTSTIDTSIMRDVGQMSAVVVGANNLPIIVYTEESRLSGGLSFIGWLRKLAGISSARAQVSIDFPDDFPEPGATTSSLKLARCTDAYCTRVTNLILEQRSDTPNLLMPLIVLNTENLPVISFLDVLKNTVALKIGRCSDTACTNIPWQTVAETGGTSVFYDLALDSNNLPVLLYKDRPLQTLNFVKCTDPKCSSANTSVVSSNVTPNGLMLTMALNNANLASIVHANAELTDDGRLMNHLMVYTCADDKCTTATSAQIDEGLDTGLINWVKIGQGQRPIITYWKGGQLSGQSSLQFVACTNRQCTAKTNALISGNNTDEVGSYGALITARDNKPLMIFVDRPTYESGILKSAKCSTLTCRR